MMNMTLMKCVETPFNMAPAVFDNDKFQKAAVILFVETMNVCFKWGVFSWTEFITYPLNTVVPVNSGQRRGTNKTCEMQRQSSIVLSR